MTWFKFLDKSCNPFLGKSWLFLSVKKYRLLMIVQTLLISACQSTQLRQPVSLPAETTVTTANFKHAMVSKAGITTRLHVYVEGDGIPFESRFVIAQDPTPVRPLMLQLMGLDKTQSLYLGRPCYFNRSLPQLADDRCNPRIWTSARYSDEVVESMTKALRNHLVSHPARGITLIGHSGGGTLAMLMAARMPEVDQVVTIAGNLDTDAWTRLHRYTPLKESLNPVNLSIDQLPRHQLHIGGDKDTNIPPALAQPVLSRLGLAMVIIPNADHNCCWINHWPQLLHQMDAQIEQ